jgi:ribose transport system substrate-binding protein
VAWFEGSEGIPMLIKNRALNLFQFKSIQSTIAVAFSCLILFTTLFISLLTKAIIQAHPNIKGIFGANEGSAIGVLNAVTELKKDKITVIGYDSGKQQIDAVKSGKMAGAITQNPIGIGYESVKAAVKAVKGVKVEKNIDTGFFWYDKSNIDAPDIKAVLYN